MSDVEPRTIEEPTADEVQQMVHNRWMRESAEPQEMDPSQKYAVCLIKLAAPVTRADYGALKTAVEDILGIQRIILLVDGRCVSSIPGGKALRLYADVQTRID